MSFPPFDRPIWACPVCGYIAPVQYIDNPDVVCPFSVRGGGISRDHRHPYGADIEPVKFVHVTAVAVLSDDAERDR